jgi:hypothetical protein
MQGLAVDQHIDVLVTRSGQPKTGGDANERGRPPAILRSAVCPRALRPTSHVFWCQFLQRLEHGFRLADLSGTHEIQHDDAVRGNHLGPISECPRRPINALGIPFCAETRGGYRVLRMMAVRVAWI